MADRYRSPILASITRGFAWCGVLCVGILAYGGYLVVEAAAQSPYFNGERAPWAMAQYAAYLPALFVMSATLCSFGIAQLIEYIGRVSYNSAQLVDAAERNEAQAASRARESLAALKAIGDIIKKAGSNGINGNVRPLAAERFFYVDAQSQILGPLGRDELHEFARNGVILNETLVCQEGADRWTTFGEIV